MNLANGVYVARLALLSEFELPDNRASSTVYIRSLIHYPPLSISGGTPAPLLEEAQLEEENNIL